MSVTSTITLPAQPPAGGSVIYVPLGGDGFTGPHSAYVVRAFNLDADVSGGTGNINVILDDRYVSLVSFVNLFIDQATPAAVRVRLELQGASTPIIRENFQLEPNAVSGDATGIWYPPTWVLPGSSGVCQIRATYANEDGDDVHMSALIYNFDIRVRELTNIGFLGFARGPLGA